MIFKTKKINIKNKFPNILSFLKNLFAIIFSIQIITFIFLLIWYFNNPIKTIYTPKRIFSIINQKSKNSIGFEVNNIGNYLKVYSLGSFYSIFKPKIENINIDIDQKNLLKLEFQRKNRSEVNGSNEKMKKKLSKYAKANLKYKNKKIAIKLRVKGDRKIHYDEVASTSYKIDLKNGKRLWGLEEFSLQKPIVRNYVYEYIFQKLNHELGNLSLNYKLVDLTINGINHGVYSIEEGFTKELLERHGKRNGPIYGIKDDLSGAYPNVIYDSYSEMKWVVNDEGLLRSGYGILNNIKENGRGFKNHIDWDAWGKFFATTDLVEAYHGALAKSVRIYYNPVSGKIEPISFDGHHGTADFKNFIILDFLSSKVNCSWICGEKEWFLKFLLDEKNLPRKEFLDSYIKHLKYITSDDFLEKFSNKYSGKIKHLNKLYYSDFSKYDNIFWKGIFPYIYDEDYLKNRAKKINKKLNSTNISNFLFSKKENKLQIKFARESIPIKIKSGCGDYINDKNKEIELWVNETKNLVWQKECNSLIVETIDQRKRKIFLFDNPIISNSLPLSFEKLPLIQDKVEGDIVDNNFFPKNKDIIISENLVLPKKITLVIREDQKIILSNSSSLVLLGNVDIQGTNKKYSVIEGVSPYYGSIISVNNIFKAKNLKIKNLIAPQILGYTFYAGINILNADVDLDNVTFLNSLSEDTLNLINSNSFVKNLTFLNSKSDALDVDSGSSKIENLTCNNIGNDCLDFSNANILANNIFTNNIYDKSISIGENSNVKVNNLNINNSEIGIAVKDNSNADITTVNIKNSTLPIAVFVKKEEYGPAKLLINNFNISMSNEVYLVDNVSKLTIDGVNYEGNFSGEFIESSLYGNDYGRATVR